MTINAGRTTTEPRSRRAILAGAIGGVAAVVAGRFASPDKTRAVHLPGFGHPNVAGAADTSLTASTPGTALLVTQNGAGTALRGSAVGPGSIAGFFTAQNGTAISGVTGNGGKYGVFAQNNGAAGTAGALRADGRNNSGVVATTTNGAKSAVSGINQAPSGATAFGVYGETDANTDGAAGVRGIDSGGGQTTAGVWGTTVSSDGAGVRGTAGDDVATGVWGEGVDGTGVYGESSTGSGVAGSSADGSGVSGTSVNANGVTGMTSSSIASGVYGENVDGYGAAGRATGDGYGVYGVANGAGAGVYGIGTANVATSTGVLGETWATTSGAAGVSGTDFGGSAFTSGVLGTTQSSAGRGVSGVATADSINAYAVHGTGSGGAYGVGGYSTSGIGTYGASTGGYGVAGLSANNVGVWGYSGASAGLVAGTGSGSADALHVNGSARVTGNLAVVGTLSKGGGTFRIDHPLDPANKTLAHSFVESPDMMNIYNGIVTTDANGEARVKLPAWFNPLNRDFRYQLTVIGRWSESWISSEMNGDGFSIATKVPGTKVSWQLTGIRQDAWANAHRVVVEEAKPRVQKGLYLHPKEHGQPESKGIGYAERKAMEAKLPKR